MPDMPRKMPPYVQKERSRHGKLMYYVRAGSGSRRRIRLKAEPFSQEWFEEYRAALEGAGREPERKIARHGTLEWLIGLYMHSPDWAALAPSTRSQRQNIFLHVIENAGGAAVAQIDRKSVERGRDRRIATPYAAKNYLKTVRALFRWAVLHGHMRANPAEGVEVQAPKNRTGFHTWTEEEIARYQAHWPLGTRERVALDVLLYTGLRRGDACVLGRQHVRDEVITIRMEKTKDEVSIPLLPDLRKTLDAGPTGDLAFIATMAGRPFKKESFGTWFRIACREAGCPGSAHGLRKAAAVRLANGGATVHQLMAWFGWKNEGMAMSYTRAADRKRLAHGAAALFGNHSPEPETRRPNAEKDEAKSTG